MNQRFPTLLLALLLLMACGQLVNAQESEESVPEVPQIPNIPSPPPNFTPPSGPPPGPPPELPDFLKNRKPASARGQTASEQAENETASLPNNRLQARQSGTPKVLEERLINVTFQNDSPESLIKFLEELSGKPVMRGQDLPVAEISFESKEPLTTSEAIDAISTLLSLNGVAIIDEGGKFMRAVPTRMTPGSNSANTGEPEEMINLKYSDETVLQVLANLEDLTGKPILRMQNIPAAKINFDSRGPMPKSEAIIAVESLLSLNGVAVTEMGPQFLKAVPIGNAPQQVPTFIHGSTLMLPPSQAYYTKLFTLEYLSVPNEANPVIQPLMSMSTSGSLVPFPKANAMLVTDALSNLQRIEQVLQEADKPQVDPEVVKFYQLTHVKARDLQQRLQALVNNQQSAIFKYTSNNTVIEADERTNQIILMTHPSNVEMLSSIIHQLDINVDPTTSSRVFYIKHAKAVDIDALLEEIITGQQQVAEEAGGNNRNNRNGNNNNNQQNPAQQAARAAATEAAGDSAGLRFSEYITIVADERSNAIVAYGTKTDLDQIATIIDEIDVLLAQVHIEVLIAEVTLNDSQMSGIDALGIAYNPEGFIEGAFLPGIGGLQGTLGGPAFNFGGAVNTDTLEITLQNAVTNGYARILSAPVIVTTHNQEATVDVVQKRPFITGSVTSGDGLGGVTQSVDYRDVGIQLTVTPLIGSNGVVQMEIEQNVENFTGQGERINGVFQPFIDSRQANSFVSVTDRQTIVLAGLQQSEIGGTDSGIWLLKDLPIIGDLFTSSNSTDNRRELMLFIKPYVIYNQEDATRGVQKALDNLDNGDDARYFMETQNMSDIYDREKEKQDKENEWPVKERRGPRQ